MTARVHMQEAPPKRLELVDATDWRDEFASEPEHSLPAPLRLGDSTDELDAFAAAPGVDAVGTDADATENRPSRFDWMRRVRRAALVGSVLAAAAAGVVVLRMPAAPLPAVEPPEPAIGAPAIVPPAIVPPAIVPPAIVPPAIVPPAIDAPASGDAEHGGGTPLVLADPALSPVVEDVPSVPPVALRSAPAAAPSVEGRTQNAGVRTDPSVTPPSEPRANVDAGPPPAARPAGVELSGATVGASATSSTAAPLLTPDVATSAGLPPPAAGSSAVAAGASATAPSPTETSPAANGLAQAAAEPSVRQLQTRAIEDVLERYRQAFNRLDVGAASLVWPTVDEKMLARAFERLRYQNVFFSSCQIVLGAMFAEATCIGSSRHEPKVGSRATKPEARRWQFGLRKSGDAWLIDRVEMR